MPATLTEPDRARLDAIVSRMEDAGESEDEIRFVVSDFQSKYATEQPSVETETAQTPIETGARATGMGAVQSVTSVLSGAGQVQKSVSDILRENVGDLPAAYFDTMTSVPRMIGPAARKVGQAAAEFFAPDSQRNPKSATIGSAIGQTPAMLGAGLVAGPAAPLVMGGFSGYDQGIQQADEMGIQNPGKRALLGAGFGAAEVLSEKMFGIGNKAATAAMRDAARRGAGQMAKGFAKSTLGEGVEEIATGVAQDALSAGLAPESYDSTALRPFIPAPSGLPALNPAYLSRRGHEFLGGAVGGALFGALDAGLNMAKKPEATDSGLTPDPLSAHAATMPETVSGSSFFVPSSTQEQSEPDARFMPPPERIRQRAPAYQGDDTQTAPATTEGDLLTDFNIPNQEPRTSNQELPPASVTPEATQVRIPDAPAQAPVYEADAGSSPAAGAQVSNEPPRTTNQEPPSTYTGPAFGSAAPQGMTRRTPVSPQPPPSVNPDFNTPGAEMWADEVINDARGRVSMGIDPKLMAAYTIKGTRMILDGVRDFAAWVKAMLAKFGSAVRDYLQGAWQAAMKNSQAGGSLPNGERPVSPSPGLPVSPSSTDPIRTTHAAVDARREAEGRDPIPHGGQGSVKAWEAEAAQMLADDPMAGYKLVADLKAKPRQIDKIEEALMRAHIGQLDERAAHFEQMLGDPQTDPTAREEAARELAHAKESLDNTEIATALAGSAWGAAGRSRQAGLDRNGVPRLSKMVADLTLIDDPTGRTPLPPEVRARVEKLHADITEKAAAAQKADDTASTDSLHNELKKLLEEAKAEIAAQKAQLEAQEHALNVQPTKVKLYTKSKEKLKAWSADGRAAQAELLRMIGVRTNMSFGVEMIPQLARIVRGFMADGFLTADAVAKKLVKAVPPDFYNSLKKFLPQIMDEADKLQREDLKKVTSEDVLAKAREKMKAPNAEVDTLPKIARKLALTHIIDHLDRGDKSLSAEKVAALVREDLEEFQPGITLREARDIISGYGQSKTPNQDVALKTMRDFRAQMQKLTQLEALMNKERLLKTGPQRDEPSARLRELQKQVEDIKRETGYQGRSREDELKSIRDRIKKSLENQIEDLQRVLAGKARPTAPRQAIAYDAELNALKTLRNQLKELVGEMAEHKLATEARRNKAALKAAQASEAEWNRRAKAQEWTRPGNAPKTFSDEVNAAREQAKAARANFEALKKAANPKYDPDAVALRQFKRRVQAQIENLNDRMKRGDFEPRKRTAREIKHDEESKRLRHELVLKKREWEDLKLRHRIANMGWGGKGLDLVSKIYHFTRSIKAGGELSGVLNQGMIPLVSHPLLTFRSIPKMFQAFLSPANETDIMDKIWMRANAIKGRYKKHRLAINDPMDYSAMQAEGNYRSQWGNSVPFFAGTGRAYTTLLNHMRADLFDHLAAKLEDRKARRGETVTDAELDAIAEEVNDSTGHGKLGLGRHEITGTAKDLLGAFVFSPSFVASRARYLAGASLWGGSKDSRAIIAKERMRAVAGFAALYALALAFQSSDDEEINATEPRDSNFMKVKYGRTYVDLLAGLQQIAVLLAREYSGVSITDGRKTDLTDTKSSKDRGDVLWNFVKSKRSPAASLIDEMLITRKDYLGRPITRMQATANAVTPITSEAIKDLWKYEPPLRAAPLSAGAFFGLRTDTREPKNP